MEIDAGNGSSPSHNHEQGFCCSANDCNWASIDAKQFVLHRWRKHRRDDPRPTRLSTMVIPMNPNKTRKQYRACCSTQQHHTDGANPKQGDEQTGADVEGLQRRKRQRLSSTAAEQEQARRSNIYFFSDQEMIRGNVTDDVEPSNPTNTRGLNPIYRKANWFTEEDRLTKGTRYHEHKHLLYHLTQGPRQGMDTFASIFLFYISYSHT